MSSLQQQFLAVTDEQKRSVHFVLGQHALAQWTAFVASRWTVTYADSVCGTCQTVDTTLPGDALKCARQSTDTARVEERYGEPLVALQDGDLDFPGPIRFAYFALYNLFMKYAGIENIDDWLIVNQALASEADESQWSPLLAAPIQEALNSTQCGPR